MVVAARELARSRRRALGRQRPEAGEGRAFVADERLRSRHERRGAEELVRVVHEDVDEVGLARG